MAKANKAISLGVSVLILIALIIIVGFGLFLNATFNTSSTTQSIATTSAPNTSQTTIITYTSTCPPMCPTVTSPTTTTGQQNQTQSSNGLELRLSVNSTSINSGESVLIIVSEYNTLTTPNNVSAAHIWSVNGLTLGSCPNEFVQPFGVAVFQGLYSTQNVSQASPLGIFPTTACPEYVRLVTGYDFQPQSDVAAVLPGGSVANGTPMVANLTVSREYGTPTQSQVLSPGIYTVIGGDEWGALTILHFTVFA